MATLLDLFGFIAVLLRAAVLALSSIAVGGVLFAFFVNKRNLLGASGERLIAVSAFGLAAMEFFSLVANSAVLVSTTKLSISELAGAQFFCWSLASMVAAGTLGVLAVRKLEASVTSLACAILLLLSEAATSHAAARLTDQIPLLVLTVMHQSATAAWIGGLPYLLFDLREHHPRDKRLALTRRFSKLSIASVALLVMGGVGLSYYYVGSIAALYGTNYGVMVVARVALFLLVLGFGAINYRILHELKTGDNTWTNRIGRIGEAEIGIGITVVLAAASLTSQPPGADLTADRVSVPTIAARMTPTIPRLETPPLSSLTPSTRQAWKKSHPPGVSADQAYIPGQNYQPSTPGDIAWSEYNHHWAGVVVLLAGIFAVLARFRLFRWARYWPLAFMGLGIFLLLRADPESWPLGPDGFWESFGASDVFQHRMFVLLIFVFAVFECGVQTGRFKSQWAALVFPGVCALGGALLLTHTHAISNIQEELLAELSHLPIALLAVMAGWSRWLELRYPGPQRKWAAPIWPVCFTLIGVVLLLYREG